jgi:hypothetical protein
MSVNPLGVAPRKEVPLEERTRFKEMDDEEKGFWRAEAMGASELRARGYMKNGLIVIGRKCN